MPISYASWLREYVGHETLILPGAGGLIRDAEGRILLQKRSDVFLWGLPGGGQELGESILDTVRREVLEEVGLEIEPGRLFGVYTSPDLCASYPNGDQVQPFVCFFECRVIGGTPRVDGEESLELGWFDLDDLPQKMTPLAAAVTRDMKSFIGETIVR